MGRRVYDIFLTTSPEILSVITTFNDWVAMSNAKDSATVLLEELGSMVGAGLVCVLGLLCVSLLTASS